MNCCKSGSHEPKQNNNQVSEEKFENKTGTLNQVVKWVLVLTLIAGLIYLLF